MLMIFRKKEKAFIMACLALFILLGISLLVDISRKCEIFADGRGAIGKVLYLHHDLRIKSRPGGEGERLHAGGPVMDNDTIVTGFDSSAGIAMGDGTLVDMCEDSIMSFGRSGDGLRITVEKGCADVKRTGECPGGSARLAIVADHRTIALCEGELSIAVPPGKSPEMFVRSGEAGVGVNGDERAIRANELAVLKPDSLSVDKKTLILSDPSENRRFFTARDDASVEFAWEYRGDRTKKAAFLVDISKNMAFSPVHKQMKSSDEMISATLPEGDYFWRVSVKNAKHGPRETSETRRFAVLKDGPFALLGPAEGEIIEYKDEPPLINFTWEPHRLASTYALEISDRGDFSRIVKKIDSSVVNVSYPYDRSMNPGDDVKLYWRVTAIGGPQSWQGRKSDSRRFIVRRGESVKQPKLVYPLDGKSMSRSRVDKEHVIFSWEKTEDGFEKRILFSRDKDFRSVIMEAPVDADHWTMEKSFPSGSYFWRVTLHDGSRNRKAVSDARAFDLRDYEDLALVSPGDKSEFTSDNVERDGLSFLWKKPDLQGKFLLEVSEDRDFKKVSAAVTTGSLRAKIGRVAPGNFYWRVRLLHDDSSIAAASETRAFTVREGLPAPVALFPRSGGAVKMLTENELNFSWKPSRGATVYQLELHQLVKEKRKTRDKLVLSTQTKESKYTVTDLNLLDVGNFYWTLRAVKKDRRNKVVRSSRKVRNNFNINLGDSKVIIVSPEIQVIEDDNAE